MGFDVIDCFLARGGRNVDTCSFCTAEGECCEDFFS